MPSPSPPRPSPGRPSSPQEAQRKTPCWETGFCLPSPPPTSLDWPKPHPSLPFKPLPPPTTGLALTQISVRRGNRGQRRGAGPPAVAGLLLTPVSLPEAWGPRQCTIPPYFSKDDGGLGHWPGRRRPTCLPGKVPPGTGQAPHPRSRPEPHLWALQSSSGGPELGWELGWAPPGEEGLRNPYLVLQGSQGAREPSQGRGVLSQGHSPGAQNEGCLWDGLSWNHCQKPP